MKCIVVVLMLCCAIPTFAQSPEAWVAYEKARGHYLTKNYDTAIPYLEEAVKHSPDFYSAYQIMANCHHQMGNVKEALVNYNKLIGKKDLDEKAWYNIGLLYVDDKQHEKGLEAFNKALQINPNYQKAAFQINLLENSPTNPALLTATHLYKQRKYQEGLDETYNIKADDMDADVFYWRGNFLKKLNKKTEAIEEYKQAINLDDRHSEAHAQLGVLHFQKKNHQEAYEHLTIASELNPDDDELMHNAGISAYHLGQYNETINWLTKYLEKKPEDRAAHYRLAVAYSETDYKALAQEHVRIAADLDYPMAVQRMEEGFNDYTRVDYTNLSERTSITRGRTNTLYTDRQAPKAVEKKMTKRELKAAKKRARKARRGN